MEKSKSAKILVKCFQDLYDQREREGDFTIVSGHQDISVHSFVISARSEVLRKTVTLDFKEKQTGKIQLDPFEKSVKAFVQFLYGVLELKKLEVETLLELMQMGEMYNVPGLAPAAESQLAQLISEENVFNLLEISKTNCFEQTHLKMYCMDYIAKNLRMESLVRNNKLQQFPDLAVYLIENSACSSSSTPSLSRIRREDIEGSVRLYDRECHHEEYSNFKTTIHSLSLSCNSPVILLGIRLSLAPGSEISVRIEISSGLSSHVVLEKGKLSHDGSESEAEPIMFAEDFQLVPNLVHDISVQVCGRGTAGARGFRSRSRSLTPTEKQRSFVSFPGKGGARGEARVNQKVVFTIIEDQGQIHELYCKHLPAHQKTPADQKPPVFNWLKKK